LRQGDIFVLPSAYEGFGLSLAEAMSMGLPAIGYKNCSAVNELIENEKNGLLCEDGVDALAEALRRLMTDKALRVKYGAYAQKSMEKYSPAKIWRSWEELLEQTVHRA
jgi:glycosyltransferase involved in cell wall biosynthesis